MLYPDGVIHEPETFEVSVPNVEESFTISNVDLDTNNFESESDAELEPQLFDNGRIKPSRAVRNSQVLQCLTRGK